jgi:hypothetical protein
MKSDGTFDDLDTLAKWWRIRAQARGATFLFPHEKRPHVGRETREYAFGDLNLETILCEGGMK